MGAGDDSRIPLQLSQGCVVASIQVDLDEDVLLRFREDLLNLVHGSRARGVILDLSGVDVMDTEDFQALRTTIEMAQLIGAKSVLSGMRAGVVSALIDLNTDTDGIEATLDLDHAFDLLTMMQTDEDVESESEDLEESSEVIPGDSHPDVALGDADGPALETEPEFDGP